MTERRRRYARAEPGSLLLTPRDREIIRACWDYRWLTREQLQRLVALPNVGRTNERLRRLYDHRFLDRIPAGTVGNGLVPIYVAAEAAFPLLGEWMDLTPRSIRKRLREDRQASAVLLPHDLELNNLRIGITAAATASTSTRLDLWHHAADCYDAYANGRCLRPDGYFRLLRDDIVSAYFLELDRGTSNLTRWRSKITRYVEYRTGGHYLRRYGLQRFRVLITVPTFPRLQQVWQVAASITNRSFWFALTDDVLTEDPLRAAIWYSLGHSGARPLVEDEE